jgi:DHA1 family bicyclomycin/chloramphenicol resistance-like MFS transporter
VAVERLIFFFRDEKMNAQSGGRAPVWLLIAISSLGSGAFDIYLPAVGGMVRSLDGDANKLQQSLSTYLIGGAIASLFIGALSDHFGRRAPMLLSIGLLAMASTACALSSTADELIFFRLLQGMASGAGAVLAVATARDQYDNVEAHRIIGRAAVLLILAPVIAPFAGGWLFVWFGWRATFVAVAGISLALLLIATFKLEESLPAVARQQLNWGSLAQGSVGILFNARFALLTLSANASFNGFFIYIVTSPNFLGTHFGLEPTDFFWFFLPLMIGLALGAQLGGRMAGRVRQETQVAFGFSLMAIMSITHVLLPEISANTVWESAAALMGYCFGWAVAAPPMLVRLTDVNVNRRGLVVSLNSAAGAFGNAWVAGVVAPAVMHTLSALGLASFALMLVGLLAWLLTCISWPHSPDSEISVGR